MPITPSNDSITRSSSSHSFTDTMPRVPPKSTQYTLGEGTSILPVRTPFMRYSIRLGPDHDLIDPLYLQKKIGLYLSHIDPEILGPKLFTKMYYLTVFKHFVSIFPLSLRSNWPPFSLILDIFNPTCLQNLRSDWDQFVSCAEHGVFDSNLGNMA